MIRCDGEGDPMPNHGLRQYAVDGFGGKKFILLARSKTEAAHLWEMAHKDFGQPARIPIVDDKEDTGV